MVIEKAMISDAEEILSLQKISYISEAEIYNDFNIPPLVQTLEQIKMEFDNEKPSPLHRCSEVRVGFTLFTEIQNEIFDIIFSQ